MIAPLPPQVEVCIDTVVVDEAGCVPEMALPTLIKLGPSQLVLVGDLLQLPAFTDLHKPPPNHTRRHAVPRSCGCCACCLPPSSVGRGWARGVGSLHGGRWAWASREAALSPH